MGQSTGGMYLVETVDDVRNLQVGENTPLAYVTQTTLSVDDAEIVIQALKQKYPTISGPKKNDICYATQNRQDAVRRLAGSCDALIVVGSTTSSNSNRLKEVGLASGKPAYLVDRAEQIDPALLDGARTIGITAGASAPEILVREVISRLHHLGYPTVTEDSGEPESIIFALPRELA